MEQKCQKDQPHHHHHQDDRTRERAATSRTTTEEDESDGNGFGQAIKIIDQSELPQMMQAVFDELICGFATLSLILLLMILARADLSTTTNTPLWASSE